MARVGSADIATMLRRDIRKGVYRQHDRLPSSREMAAGYGVARNTLREALMQIESEGLIETRRGSGTYVIHDDAPAMNNAVDGATPLELIDTRFALEPHICRLCVLHARREDFDLLDEQCSAMEAAIDDPRAFSEADTMFHRTLAEATRNRLLIWIIDQVTRVRSQEEWNRMRRITLDHTIISQYNVQHRQVLNAIRSREPERAATHMKEHLETARLSLTRAADA